MILKQLFLMLTMLVTNVKCSGNTQIYINSNSTVMIQLQNCFLKYYCHITETEDFDSVELMEIVSEEPFLYEVPFVAGIKDKGELLIDILYEQDTGEFMNCNNMFGETETLIYSERKVVPLSLEFYNFTIAYNNDSSIDFAIRNVCDEDYIRDACNFYCKPDKHYMCVNGNRTCTPEYTGYLCRTPVCPNACSGNGICVAPSKCQCRQGFIGESCNTCITRDNCTHGTCVSLSKHYILPFTCKCLDGYKGENCDEDDICYHARPCRYGKCIPNNDKLGFHCQCNEGYFGTRCDRHAMVFDCTVSTDCKNGGRCLFYKNRSRCKCRGGYKGKFCERKSNYNCNKKRCRAGYVCVMDNGVPICVNTVTPGPLVTVKQNASSVIYQIFYGQFHWKFHNSTWEVNKALKNAVNKSSVNIYYMQQNRGGTNQIGGGPGEDEEYEDYREAP
ncbi:CRE-DSL-4 protein [Caenorhabditis remanei]|uniref:CRE-DSL-4 protein n=1 Tax=Caenorhabditis remanei TaxID=31234 RepID=E3ME98_CAERE|nr:CRE-DSL-4 protein [Caenorhabditis remanei]